MASYFTAIFCLSCFHFKQDALLDPRSAGELLIYHFMFIKIYLLKCVCTVTCGFLHFAHLWGGWRSSASTGPRPCCRSQYGGPGCGRCCSPGRSHPAHKAASLPPPWRGTLASATWDCGPTTGPVREVEVADKGSGRGVGGWEGRKWCDADEKEVRCSTRREGERNRVGSEGGWIRRLIFKHIHAWVIDVCSVLDK